MNSTALVSKHAGIILAVLTSCWAVWVWWRFGTYSSLVRPGLWQLLLAGMMAILYVLPVFIPALRRLVLPVGLKKSGGEMAPDKERDGASPPPARGGGVLTLAVAVLWWLVPLAMWMLMAAADHTMKVVHADPHAFQAAGHVDPVVATVERILGKETRRLALANYAFERQSDRRSLPEAEWAWKEVLKLSPQPFEKGDKQVLMALHSLGAVCARQRQFGRSEDYYRQLLTLVSQGTEAEPRSSLRFLEKESIPRLRLDAIIGLARSLAAQGRYSESARYYEKYMQESGLKRQQQPVAVLDEIAEVHFLAGNASAAEPYARLSVAAYRRNASYFLKQAPAMFERSGAEDLASACDRYARILRATDRAKEAEKYENLAAVVRSNKVPAASSEGGSAGGTGR